MDLPSKAKEVSHHMTEENMAGSLGDASASDLKMGYCSKGKAGDAMGPYTVDTLEVYL